MRDGIWKDLPVPKEWQRVVKRCSRPSERGQPAITAVRFALHARAETELPAAFRDQVDALGQDSESSLPGMDHTDETIAALESTGSRSPSEFGVLRSLRWHRYKGLRGHDLVRAAYKSELTDQLECMSRQIQTNLTAKCEPGASEVLQHFRNAASSVDRDGIVDDVIARKKPDRKTLARKIDPDEDLSQPK